MKNNNLFLHIILFASISIGIFSFGAVSAEIGTDKSVYSKGDLITISGSLDLQDDQRVNIVEIEITSSDGEIIINEYTPVNNDNEFSRLYETTTWVVGDYTSTVSYNDVEESTEFTISGSSSSDDEDTSNSDNNESDPAQQESSLISSNDIQDSPADFDASSTEVDVPTNVVAKVVSSTSVELSWNPPTQTYGQAIQDYTIKQELSPDVYDEIVSSVSTNTEYHIISNLSTDETYTFVVVANYLRGSSDVSEKSTVTLISSSNTNNNGESENNDQESSSESTNNSSSIVPDDIPDSPVELEVKPVSSTQIDLLWSAPKNVSDNNLAIVGYGIEFRTADNLSYFTVIDDTENTDTKYSHTGLVPNTTYIYRVFAINDIGSSEPSSENLANTLISDIGDDNENNTTQPENELSSTQDDDSTDDSNVSTLSTVTSGAPVDLTAIPISQNRINLSWSAPIDNDDDTHTLLGYMIESKTSDESDYTILVTNTGSTSTTTYSHTGLTAGLTYNYRVSAVTSLGENSAPVMAEATIISTDSKQSDIQKPQSSSSQLQPLQVTVSTDKSIYAPGDSIEISGTTGDSIEISGTTTGDPTQTIPLGMRVVSSDGTIVYARSISIDNDKTFETVITPLQRQSSVWQGNAEFTVEVTYDGRVQTTTTFETENSGTVTENGSSSANQPENGSSSANQPENGSSSANQPENGSNDQQQSPPSSSSSESTTGIVSNDEFETLKNQNTALQSANQQLQDENNQLKIQIDELGEKIEQLNTVIMEQVRVMMETINASSGN